MSQANAHRQPAIRGQSLTVRRGEHVVFAGLDFEIGPGEVLVLRGPNGAGKSTLLLTLAGIIRPETGTLEMGAEETAAGSMHFAGHLTGIKPRLTVTENLDFWAELNGGSPALVPAALAEVGLADLAALEAGYLSAGQTRRLALARLLVAERPVWLLDEPTASLDAAGEALAGRLITAQSQRGGITIVATHHDLAIGAGIKVRTLNLGASA